MRSDICSDSLTNLEVDPPKVEVDGKTDVEIVGKDVTRFEVVIGVDVEVAALNDVEVLGLNVEVVGLDVEGWFIVVDVGLTIF